MSGCITGLQSRIVMPSSQGTMRWRASSARCGESSSRMGLVLLMWISRRRVRAGRRSNQFDHAAFAALRQVADVARGLLRQAHLLFDHLVVGPEGAVHQHRTGAAHQVEQRRRDLAEARCIEQRCAAASGVGDQHTPMLSPGTGFSRCGEYGAALLSTAGRRAADRPPHAGHVERPPSSTMRSRDPRRSSGRARAAPGCRCVRSS